ncbi:hypothetical protein [Leptospira kmetyi]|uniref:Uncharacterized protein n=1 Tax=Leptospira kmetyi TaxID=408139 RepID=A0A2M9XTG2_9LEPT|nr:hypothetical protein [Leptospira kmetyi]AYV54671.1 hypothetical protein EFP84_03500 [Leptospira kmetyi]PJZ31541.1 hypothetical protein CH378_01720 [Leptospira kmetyi]PJZ42594.1 hypothetical protein CH370_05085 [Leptospira kmetyi]TGK13676.1 hypothetical protein EHO62_18260 [Leptospira kmetyi]TGK29161.1 hypothetical protein EHO66_10255 [Leptospira kmetyi]
MRLSDTFLGYGQAPDLIRKQQVENPFTMPHMISETARMVKEYNDTRKYAVELYTDVFSLSPESRERMASARNQKIDQIKDRLKTYKPAVEGRTESVTYSALGQKTSNAPANRGRIEFFA